MNKLKYFDSQEAIYVENPTEGQTEKYIFMLHKKDSALLIISSEDARISIFSTNTDRLVFNYYSGVLDENSGYLSDNEIDESNSKRIEYLIPGGQMDIVQTHRTVGVKLATEIAKYFILYNQVPNGLRWYGEKY